MNKESALRITNDLTEILKKHKINFWLQDGTLLGYYRENKIIDHDNDIDIGLFFSSVKENKQVFHEIINAGYRLFKIKGYMEDSLLLTFLKDDVKIDLFFYYELSNNQIYHSSFTLNSQIVNYLYESFQTKIINFSGYYFPVPENEEKFILTKYGKNWKIPNVEWNHILDPENACPTEKYIDVKECRVLFRAWLKSDD